MFIISLKFSDNKAKAPNHMEGHNEWIKRGFDDSVFLLVGSILPGKGGCIIAHNSSLQDLEARVKEDPFVAEDIVRAEIAEVAANRVDERLSFLMD